MLTFIVAGAASLGGLHAVEIEKAAQPAVLIDAGKVGAAYGAVLVERKVRAVNAPVTGKFLGFFKVADGVVDAVFLFVQQRGVEPGAGVVRVNVFCDLEFVGGALFVAGVGVGFAEVTPQDFAAMDAG